MRAYWHVATSVRHTHNLMTKQVADENMAQYEMLMQYESSRNEGKKAPPPPPTAHVGPKYSPGDFHFLKVLGKGSFGNVVLAEDKENHNQYAMKIIEKSKIKEFNVLQCELIRKISVQELFVTVRETFQNENKIYIVMEYLPRGDIYFYLKRKEFVFKEDVIKLLLAEIIVGI